MHSILISLRSKVVKEGLRAALKAAPSPRALAAVVEASKSHSTIMENSNIVLALEPYATVSSIIASTATTRA